MRLGPYSIQHDNLVVSRIRLWADEAYEVDADDGYLVRVGIQRGKDVSWLAVWDQRETTLQEQTSHILSGVEELNYPLQADDVIVAEDAEYGSPSTGIAGLVAEVQLSRVGEVEPIPAEARPGFPAGQAIRRPLVSNPAPKNLHLELLARQLNESGLPDMSLPIYFGVQGAQGTPGIPGASTFLALTDTPSSYASEGGKVVAVNVGETALEFISLTSYSTFLSLTDTPSSYSGEAGKMAIVNPGETAVIFATPLASPLTTKGDLWGYDTADARVPVGSDGQVLEADSADAQGVAWKDRPTSWWKDRGLWRYKVGTLYSGGTEQNTNPDALGLDSYGIASRVAAENHSGASGTWYPRFGNALYYASPGSANQIYRYVHSTPATSIYYSTQMSVGDMATMKGTNLGGALMLACDMGFPSITDVQACFGLFAPYTTWPSNPHFQTDAAKVVASRFDRATSDAWSSWVAFYARDGTTNWHFATGVVSATTSAQEKNIDTGVAFAASTMYVFAIEINWHEQEIYAYIDGALVATVDMTTDVNPFTGSWITTPDTGISDKVMGPLLGVSQDDTTSVNPAVYTSFYHMAISLLNGDPNA